MISSKYDIVLGIGLVFLLLTISFAGEGRFDILAQGTNAQPRLLKSLLQLLIHSS